MSSSLRRDAACYQAHERASDLTSFREHLSLVKKAADRSLKLAKEIIEMGFDKALVDRTLGLVNRNEFKRYQTAPVLRVSSKAFGMGRRLPIVAKYLN